MATGIGKLTDLKCKNAVPGKHFDGGGFFLHVTETGRYWRLKYRFARREKLLALGVYPQISLAKARTRRDEARKRLLDGFDPGAERQAEKLRAQIAAENTFEAVAREWLEVKAHQWTKLQLEKEQGRLKNHAFPWIGRLPVADLGVPEIRPLLSRIVKRGHLEQAHRLRHQLSRIFRYAVATERAGRDPAADLRDTLPTRPKKNYPTITDPKQVGELLRAIDAYSGTFEVLCALKLAPLWFCRPGEIRLAEWSHFDMDSEHPTYAVPPENRKLRKAEKENPTTPPHLVPLSRQALVVLRELQALTGHKQFLFPGARTPRRPMSDGAVNMALARMGYKGIITGHGFRHMARTLLGELGWNPEALERQMAHKEPGVAGVYNKAQHLAERRKIMQAWADYLDGLRVGGNVIPMQRIAKSLP